jgi:stage III sporulation protein AH
VRIAGYANPRAGFVKKVNWKAVIYLILLGVILYFVGSKWSDFALFFSGSRAVPAANMDAADDFFIEFKIDREKTHKEQVDMVKAVMADNGASKEIRDAAYAQYMFLIDVMGKELKIEGLLKAKGFETLVFLAPDSCTVAVKTVSLDERQVAQIGDAVRKVTKLGLDKVTIFALP